MDNIKTYIYIIATVLAIPIVYIIFRIALSWIICFFQDINHSIRKANRYIKGIRQDVKWAVTQMELKKYRR